MLISDWSSDVCSSDLCATTAFLLPSTSYMNKSIHRPKQQLFARRKYSRVLRTSAGKMRHEDQLRIGVTTTLDEPVSETIVRPFPRQHPLRNVFSSFIDRKCVV